KVEPSSIEAHIRHLSHTRRSLQLSHKRSPLVDSFSWLLGKYLRSSSVSGAVGESRLKSFNFVQDRREPELVVYSGSFAVPSHVYTVKPIVFDLVLVVIISGYLFGVYWLIVGVVPKFL
ncbi:hypothetical protein M8J75_005694, partial [Diaphorina citri]